MPGAEQPLARKGRLHIREVATNTDVDLHFLRGHRVKKLTLYERKVKGISRTYENMTIGEHGEYIKVIPQK